MRNPLLLAVAGALVACGSNASSTLSTYRDFGVATQRLFCQNEVACGFYDPAREADCELTFTNDTPAPSPSTFDFDLARAQRCFDALKSALDAADCHTIDYSSMMLNDACTGVTVGKQPAGGSCPNFVECAPGTTCSLQFQSGGQCSSMCVAVPALGAPCDSFCNVGAFCDGQSHTCLALLDEGATCSSANERSCKDGLTCIAPTAGAQRVCRARGAAGASCQSGSDCARGLACDNQLASPVCTTQKKAGESCDDDGDCATRLVCTGVFGAPGICSAPIPLGGACLQTGCLRPYNCIDGRCTAPALLGAPCMKVGCLTGYCNSTSGNCEPRLPAGSACDPAQLNACTPNSICNSTSKTCVACT